MPNFGEPTIEPTIPRETYDDRVKSALRLAADLGVDALIVYGDREHVSSIAFLTGYDPRFEEALAVIVMGRKPTILVGNEGWAYSELAAGTFERVLYQSFSLMGQPRGENPPLATLLANAGIKSGQRVGLVGWKHFDHRDQMDETAIELPHYIVEAVREVVGSASLLQNAGAIFANASDGLRVINDVDQLAVMEHAATFTSQALRNVIFGLEAGMTERQAVRLMGVNGLPQAAHLMLSTGDRARYGLPSPSDRKIGRGDPLTMAYCVWGSLTARAGFVAAGPHDLPADTVDYVDRLVAPYFSAAVAWYETLGIGVAGRRLHEAVHSRIGDPFFGVTLNPGHLIHMDEWVHSPVTADSSIPLRSGMALQIDIIPATGTHWYTSNIEDGVALADAELRARFSSRYPEAWKRIQARRTFMIETLGIRLAPEVLPFSNIPAYLTPYLLAPRHAMAVVRT